MLMYDKKLGSYYEVIPVSKIEEKIKELGRKIETYNELSRLGKETDVEFYEFIGNDTAKAFLQQLIAENKEEE